MTFDLEAAKRLAQQLAGDVLNQIERDGSVNRENIAGQLLAGLVLEAAAIVADAEKGVSCTAAEARQIVERRGAWNAQKEYLQKIATRRAMREMYVQDVRTVDVKLWRMKDGERVPVEATPENCRYAELAHRKGAPVEVINGDTWFFPDGRVMSGLELFQTGRTALQIWAETDRTQTRDL